MTEKPITMPKAEPVEQKHRPSRQDNSDEIRRQLEKSLRDDIKTIRTTLIEKKKQIAKMENVLEILLRINTYLNVQNV